MPTADAADCRSVLPLVLGVALTLTLRGYQYGGGNHAVYLIAPLREVHPELLTNDWWATGTLQYHVAFTKLTASLMRAGIVEPAFLTMYLGLVVAMHVAWRRVVVGLGLSSRVYVLSVVLYYLSAGGTGLGSYQFLQDSSFLPGNLANVAMLWGLMYWIAGRTWPAAAGMAVAGLFHLNHALLAIGFWPLTFSRWHGRLAHDPVHGRDARATSNWPGSVGGFALIVLFSLPNIIPAARLALSGAPKMPLAEFVDLYVRLRHPHHYDPSSWPVALWVSFLWPIPLAVLAYRRMSAREPARRAAFVVAFFVALQLVALVFAGIVFVSEPLIQMSLFRFSIYPKLLTCVGAAMFLLDPKGVLRSGMVRTGLVALPILLTGIAIGYASGRPLSTPGAFVLANVLTLELFAALASAAMGYVLIVTRESKAVSAVASVAIVAGLFFGRSGWLGLRVAMPDHEDAAYLAVCDFARRSTPSDAVFVVPPNELLFRLRAQRAIVVNFKHVPQLAGEMREWRSRLEAVLDAPLSTLPRRFDLAHAAIARRYDEAPTERLVGVARRYGARYVLTATPRAGLKAVFETGCYHLYDLGDGPR